MWNIYTASVATALLISALCGVSQNQCSTFRPRFWPLKTEPHVWQYSCTHNNKHVRTVPDLRRLNFDALPGNARAQLDLSHNEIRTIRGGDFVYMSGLSSLVLSHNHMRRLTPFAFANLTRLKRLDLGHNQLRHMHLGLSDRIAALEWLSVRDNYISTLWPGALANFPALKTLELQNNRIKEILPGAFGKGQTASGLTEIDLSGNDLLEVREGVFNVLPNLRKLNLSGNGPYFACSDVDRLFPPGVSRLDLPPCRRNTTTTAASLAMATAPASRVNVTDDRDLCDILCFSRARWVRVFLAWSVAFLVLTHMLPVAGQLHRHQRTDVFTTYRCYKL